MALPSGESIKAYVEAGLLILDRLGSWFRRTIPQFLAGGLCTFLGIWAYFPGLLDPEPGNWVTGKELVRDLKAEIELLKKNSEGKLNETLLDRDKEISEELSDIINERNREISENAIRDKNYFDMFFFLYRSSHYIKKKDSNGTESFVQIDKGDLLQGVILRDQELLGYITRRNDLK